tara:strand:- start:2444 stop:2641 length:198 start_codon:yes stop_codon:yes gene_type:complete
MMRYQVAQYDQLTDRVRQLVIQADESHEELFLTALVRAMQKDQVSSVVINRATAEPLEIRFAGGQ